MFLAFKLSDLVTVPFGYVMDWLYLFTQNYGVTLILFTLVVKLILYPLAAKSKKSMMKMSRIQPYVKQIQEKYAGDQMKQNEAMQRLYKEEGVDMTGGCLWSFIPLLILLPLYTVVRQPIVYMLHETLDNANAIVAAISNAAPELFGKNSYYHQMVAAAHIPEFVDAVKTAVPTISDSALKGVNFNFLGIDLGSIPSFNVFAWDSYDWAHIGLFLLPVLSAGSQVLSSWLMNKQNNSVVVDENGLQDEETAKNSQAAQSTKMMMYMMPLMTLWIGFSMPGALSLYWLIQGLVSMVQDTYLTKHYRVIYDAEDAERQARMRERMKAEEEKERVRAERRAANPDGITANTSKKKLEKKQALEEEAAKAAAKKEYNAKKGVAPEETEENTALSGIADRPYCKGRAYNPNRYKHPEE